MPERAERAVPRLPEGATPQEILLAGIAAAAGPVALACSFSIEDVVLIDMLAEVAPPPRVFAIDTGRLPEETYEVAESVRLRYGVAIAWFLPDREQVERLQRERGLHSFREGLPERRACCALRKVAPLERALVGLHGWITGMRREHSESRGHVAPLELDHAHGGLLKLNPLAEMSNEALWAYARARQVPVSRLYKAGYASIGCAPCTRPLRPGEPLRAGRWWWEDPDHKECGLHSR